MAQTLDLAGALAQSDAALKEVLAAAARPGLFGLARRLSHAEQTFQDFLRSSITYVDDANLRLPDELELSRATDHELRKTAGFFKDIVQRLEMAAAGEVVRLTADHRLKVNLARMKLLDALEYAEDELGRRASPSPSSLPAQQPAPAQFAVVEGRIQAVRPRDEPDAEDVENTLSARHAILSKGEALLLELRASNCDRRLIEALAELQTRVADQTAMIEVGIAQMALAKLAAAAAEELSPVLSADLGAHVTMLGMYAAQFSSWRRFTENAAIVALDTQAVSDVAQSAGTVVRELEAQPHLADEDTPRIIRLISALIEEPGEAGKRAAFGTLRLLENLIAKIYEYGIAFVDKTVRKTIDDASSVAAKAATVALLGVAIGATAQLTGVSAKVPEAAWIKSATDVAKQQLEKLLADAAAKQPPSAAPKG